MTREFFTVAEFMKITGLSRSAAYKAVNNEVPTVRLGKKILVPAWFVKKLASEPQK